MNDPELPKEVRENSVNTPKPADDRPASEGWIGHNSLAARLLAGNPLYLVSAAMMLYGLHLVATDPVMLRQELSKLWFNVSSLEIYELMIVGTAVVLARRKIWYDSNLLITLENMFMFVPFILISQATLFDDGTEAMQTAFAIDDANVWTVCVVACALACVRFAALRQIVILRMPVSLIVFGMALIAVNVAAPIWFRYAIGKDETQAWTLLSPYIWTIFLPLAVLLANFIPHLKGPADASLSRRNWPLVLPLLWIVATAVHVRTVDYLDDLPFALPLAAPLAWTIAWTASFRPGDFTAAPSDRLKSILTVSPFVLSFAAIGGESAHIMLALALGNAAVYGWLALTGRRRSLATQMAIASLAMAFAALPEGFAMALVPNCSREKIVILAHMAYLTYLFSLNRSTEGSICGAIMSGGGIAYYIEHFDYLGPYALQAGLLFALIHSMFWPADMKNARAIRFALALALPAHSFVWGYVINFRVTDINVGYNIMLAGLLVLAVHWLLRLVRGEWGAKIYPQTGGLMILTVPLNFAIDVLKVAPKGHLTILGSFVVFVLATYVALNKDKWLQSRDESDGAGLANEPIAG